MKSGIQILSPMSFAIAGTLFVLGLFGQYLSAIYLSVLSLILSSVSILVAGVLHLASVSVDEQNWQHTLRKLLKYQYPLGFAAIAAVFLRLLL